MEDWDAELLFDDSMETETESESHVSNGPEILVALIDCSPSMCTEMDVREGNFSSSSPSPSPSPSYLNMVLSALSEDLKARVIAREGDKVGLVFFNTRERRNIQNSEGVYVSEELTVPSALFIKKMTTLSDTFEKEIGSKDFVEQGSDVNPLYNALWVVQAMFRTGSSNPSSHRKVLLFTNNDDPFGEMEKKKKTGMEKMTITKSKDIQELGIGFELFPFNRPGEEFNFNIFFSNMIELDEEDSSSYMHSAIERFQDLKSQIRRKGYKKRMIQSIPLFLCDNTQIAFRTYALIRRTAIKKDMDVRASDNVPVKTETSLLCKDTGAIISGQVKKYQVYGSSKVIFCTEEIKEVKKICSPGLQLLGFKDLSFLKDYHNLSPPTFLYPDEKEIKGSMCAFIALHSAMIQLRRFGVVCWSKHANSRLAALVAQEEKVDSLGQLEPPGFHLIPLPFFDDIRHAEKYHPWAEKSAPRATENQIEIAANLLRKISLKNFSLQTIQNPSLQTHYAVLEALALEEESSPPLLDSTLPDYNTMNLDTTKEAVMFFKGAVYGANHEEEEKAAREKALAAAENKKRKALPPPSPPGDWGQLADEGKLQGMKNEDLRDFLRSKGLPSSGKKQDIIARILKELGR